MTKGKCFLGVLLPGGGVPPGEARRNRDRVEQWLSTGPHGRVGVDGSSQWDRPHEDAFCPKKVKQAALVVRGH